MSALTKNEEILPFLRWAGGKSWLINEIKFNKENYFNNYFEPFFGGGAFLCKVIVSKIIKNQYFVSDLNEQLIETYKAIALSPSKVIEHLRRKPNNRHFYYSERDRQYRSKEQRAAKFIYLNKTSFNGLYRENLLGNFNVPYGGRAINYDDLKESLNTWSIISSNRKVKFDSSDFESIFPKVKQGDLIYFDPPYTVAHENNGFIKYNQRYFTWEDQVRLRDMIKHVKRKKAYYILSNAYHDSILNLYDGVGKIYPLVRQSSIGVAESRRKTKEILVTNIPKSVLEVVLNGN